MYYLHGIVQWRMNRILFYTLQSLQQGPVAHSASVVNLQVIGSQQGSSSWHSSIVPQSHCSPSSITLFPHLLISNCISKADLVTITRDYTNLMRFYAHWALDSFKRDRSCNNLAKDATYVSDFYLVWFVKKAEAVAGLQGFYIVGFTTFWKLVRLNIF